MQAAAHFVRESGGLEATRVFTRIWLAMVGQWSWDQVPVLPPELILLPSWVPLNIYDFACWARQTIVPLTIVSTLRPVRPLPFDLPEGESEIIGYFVEYASMGFGLFMLGEFIEVVVLGALFTTLFLGGWQLPWLLGPQTLFLGLTTVQVGPWLHALIGMAIFATKVFLMCALQLQVRWTLPRFRYDQLMDLAWKSLIPLALINLVATAAVVQINRMYFPGH